MSHTIYHAHGIGEGALDGLLDAARRIQEARRRLFAQPPAPLPPMEVPEAPELPQVRGGFGLEWTNAGHRHAAASLVAIDGERRVLGAVEGKILAALSPAEILSLTEAAEALAGELEAAAEARAAEIERRTREAIEDADPAIRALGERLSAKRREAAEREAWILEHGSPRLRRLLEEGIEHMAVYRDERLAAERPGWRWDDMTAMAHEPRNASEAALALLDAARQTAPDARLVYRTIAEELDEWGEVVSPRVRGYTCEARFLGREIVYQVEADGTPPVVIESDED